MPLACNSPKEFVLLTGAYQFAWWSGNWGAFWDGMEGRGGDVGVVPRTKRRSEQKWEDMRWRKCQASLHDWRCRGKWQSTSPRSRPRRTQPITMQIRAGCGLGGLLRCNHISWPERKRLSDLNHWRLEKRGRRGTTFSLPKPPVPHLHNNVINKPNMSVSLCAWELENDTSLVGWSRCYVQT